MKFLLDQHVPRRIATWLRSQGHDVTIVGVEDPADVADEAVIAEARRDQRILLTTDPDLGMVILRYALPHAGVIDVWMPDATTEAKIARLATVLVEEAERLHRYLIVHKHHVSVSDLA